MTALENGTMREGYGYEYVWLVSNFTGWNVEYVFGKADDLYSMLLRGDIDLLPFVSYSEEKAESILFPDFSMGSEKYNLYAINNTENISSQNLSSLTKKIIGVINESYEAEVLETFLKDKKLNSYVFKFENEFQRNNALLKGLVDVVVDTEIHKKRNWNTVWEIGEDDLYLAVSGKNTELLEELNSALSQLYDLTPDLNSDLSMKYYQTSSIDNSLSSVEEDWLSKHQTIKIGYNNDILSDVSITSDGAKGFLPDLMTKIGQSLGVTINFDYIEFDSDKDLQNALRSGEVDIAYPVVADIYGGELSDYVPTHKVNSTSMCVITGNNIGTYTIKSLAATDSVNSQYFSKLIYPDTEIVQGNSITKCLSMVQDGTVEGLILPTKYFDSLVKGNLQYDSLYATNLSKLYEGALGVSKNNTELWMILERGLSVLGSDEISVILNQNQVQEAKVTFKDVIDEYYWVLILIIVVGIALVVIILIGSRQRKQQAIQNEILSAANKRAEFASKAKSDFLFNMSHDIRTPMNAILSYTDKAIDEVENHDKVVDSLNKVKISGNMLLNIINDILDMSRIESGKAVVREEKHNIKDTFKTIETMANELASAKNINVSFEIENITDEIYYSDFSLIERVLLNIVSNAIKFTEPGGYVKAKVEQIDTFNGTVGVFKYTVEDNGIGMSEEFQKHCFEQFTREQSPTVNNTQGTGLGLALAYSIVQTLHGTINCESELGKGSKFTVVLPLTVSNQLLDDLLITEKNYDYTILDGKTVLLVEDNEFNKEITTDILSEKGIIVETAGNGKEAVEIVNQKGIEYYDFILMDIQMPIMDGYEATRIIRSNYHDSSIPIIALSANAFEEDKQKSYASGMNAHIAKPLNKKVMFDTITELLSRNPKE